MRSPHYRPRSRCVCVELPEPERSRLGDIAERLVRGDWPVTSPPTCVERRRLRRLAVFAESSSNRRDVRTSRKSSIFLRRKVGVVFMRVNSKCAHQVRPPLTQTRGGQRSVNIGKHLAPTRDPPLGAVHSGGPLRQPAVLSFGSPSPGHNIAPAFQPLAATGDFTLELVSEQTRHLANHPSTALGTSP